MGKNREVLERVVTIGKDHEAMRLITPLFGMAMRRRPHEPF